MTSDISRLRKHFAELKVKNRLSLYCSREYLSWKTKKSKSRFNVRQALRVRLSEVEEGEEGKDWKSALYLGMLENQCLITYLNNIVPTQPEEAEVEAEVEIDF